MSLPLRFISPSVRFAIAVIFAICNPQLILSVTVIFRSLVVLDIPYFPRVIRKWKLSDSNIKSIEKTFFKKKNRIKFQKFCNELKSLMYSL